MPTLRRRPLPQVSAHGRLCGQDRKHTAPGSVRLARNPVPCVRWEDFGEITHLLTPVSLQMGDSRVPAAQRVSSSSGRAPALRRSGAGLPRPRHLPRRPGSRPSGVQDWPKSAAPGIALSVEDNTTGRPGPVRKDDGPPAPTGEPSNRQGPSRRSSPMSLIPSRAERPRTGVDHRGTTAARRTGC
jgi:hypothetical protein